MSENVSTAIRHYKWSHFIIDVLGKPSTGKYKKDPGAYYAMFVIQTPQGELLFFSYNIAFALGYDDPSVTVKQLVPPEDQIRLDFASGIFLSKEGVYKLMQQSPTNDAFKNWFESYVHACESDLTSSHPCPK